MNFQVEWVYEKGSNQVNEDAYVLDEERGVFAVIDGATGLKGLPGKLASEVLKQELMDFQGESLLQTVTRGNRLLGKKAASEMKVNEVSQIPKEHRSLCALAGIQIHESELEYVHAGDCMLFIRFGDGTIHSVTRDHVFPLDDKAIAQYMDLWKAKTGDELNISGWNKEKIDTVKQDIFREIRPTLLENRKKVNVAGGYPALDGSSEAAEFLEYGWRQLENVTEILLLSDGMQLLGVKGDFTDVWNETASYAFEYGVTKLMEKVMEQEREDYACIKYPRLKYADDKTGIFIRLVK